MTIKLDDFKMGESLAIQIIKKVDVDDYKVIAEINKEIETAYPKDNTEHVNRS